MGLDALVLAPPVVVAGIALGLVRHGRLRHLAQVRIRAPALLAVGLALPAATFLADPPGAVPLAVAGLATLLAFCAGNLHLHALAVVGVGISCNLVPLVLNGAVPVDADALAHTDRLTATAPTNPDLPAAHRLERPGDRLTVLGARIPIPETGQIVSFGDLIVLVGLGALGADLARGRSTARARPPLQLSRAAPPRQVDAAATLDLRRFERAIEHGRARVVTPDQPPRPKADPHTGDRAERGGLTRRAPSGRRRRGAPPDRP